MAPRLVRWYAVKAVTDQPDYPAGEIVSYTTVPPAPELCAQKGLKCIDLGEHPDNGIDFAVQEMDAVEERLTPRPAPAINPRTELLAKDVWDQHDMEQAIRFLLTRGA